MDNNSSRKPRFRRSVDIPTIQITERDIEIIRQVHKHRFLRSDHIVALLQGSRQNILRRLQVLYHHHFLDRPHAQLEYYRQDSNHSIVYALGNRGADILAERFSIPRQKIDWMAKNQSAKQMFLKHTLLIADVMVRLETACRSTGVRLIDSDEILAQCDVSRRHRQEPFKWHVQFRNEGFPLSLGVHPDHIFGLQLNNKPAYFFLEADRATMPVERENIVRSSLFRKMLAYHQSWKQELHRRYFNIERFCVLTVTTSAERIENAIKANKHFNNGNGSRIFLFADKSLLSENNVLNAPIKNGSSELATLLDIIQ